jgi:hypothetical protein
MTIPAFLMGLGIVLAAFGGVWTTTLSASQATLLTRQSAYIAHQSDGMNDMRTQLTEAHAQAARARADLADITVLADKRKADNVALAGYTKTLLAQLQATHKDDAVKEVQHGQ